MNEPGQSTLPGQPLGASEGISPLRWLVSGLAAVAVTAVCLWLLVTPQVLDALSRILTQASPLPVLGAFALITFVQWLRSWRFAVMMSGRLALPGTTLMHITLQLNLWNFLLPMRLGELSYPMLMKRQLGYGFLHSAGVLLIVRLFDLAAVGAILLGAAAVLDVWPGPVGRTLLVLGAIALGIAPFGLAVAGLALRPWLARLPHVGGHAEKLMAGFEAIGGYGAGLVAVGLGLATWLIFGLLASLLAGTVVSTVSPAAAMLGAAAGNVAFGLPINGVAGIGPTQAAWVAATTHVGVPWDDAVVSALALHAVVLANAVVLGAVSTAVGGRALWK